MKSKEESNKIVIEAKDIGATYRHLTWKANMTHIDASNLIAQSFGLEAAEKGWALKEIHQVLFLRSIQTRIPS